MAINTLFNNIADAIREKLNSTDTYTPAQMPDAIRSIETGGGVEIIQSSVWETLTTEEKQSYSLVAIQTTDSGYKQGILVNGAAYDPFFMNIKTIVIGGSNRGNNTYTQLGDIRFSDGSNYLSDQSSNTTGTTTYGSFITSSDEGPGKLFDNTANTKCISTGGGTFEWVFTFTNTLDLSTYNIIELWTANDSSERDPYTNVYIKFINIEGTEKTLTIGSTNLPTTRKVLGYSNNSWQSELV